MSIYRKDNNGNIKKIAGLFIKTYNTKWFNVTRSIENGLEIYTLNNEDLDYFEYIQNRSIFNLNFTEPNTTTTPKLRIGARTFDIYSLISATGEVSIGVLLSIVQFYFNADLDTNKVYIKEKAGATPEIGENGNWYISGEDTGKPSRGEIGPQGPQGDPGEPGGVTSVDGKTGDVDLSNTYAKLIKGYYTPAVSSQWVNVATLGRKGDGVGSEITFLLQCSNNGFDTGLLTVGFNISSISPSNVTLRYTTINGVSNILSPNSIVGVYDNGTLNIYVNTPQYVKIYCSLISFSSVENINITVPMTAFDGTPVANVVCEYGNINAGNITQNGNQVAQLSQVVRTDTNQELSDTQKYQALVNLSMPITDVIKFPRDTKILLYTWDKTVFPGAATCFKIDIYGAGDYGTAGIATYVVKGNSGSICGYLINDNNTYGFCPTIYTYANGNDINLYIEVPNFVDTCSLVITQDYAFKNNIINSIPLLNQAVTDYSGTLISSSKNNVIIGYAPVLSLDPTKLIPSTDNEWSFSQSPKLVEPGLYAVCVDCETNNPAFVDKSSIGFLFYDGYKFGICSAYVVTTNSVISGSYATHAPLTYNYNNTTGTYSWSYSDRTINKIYYKKVG